MSDSKKFDPFKVSTKDYGEGFKGERANILQPARPVSEILAENNPDIGESMPSDTTASLGEAALAGSGYSDLANNMNGGLLEGKLTSRKPDLSGPGYDRMTKQ